MADIDPTFLDILAAGWREKATSIIKGETILGPQTQALFIDIGRGLAEAMESRIQRLDDDLERARRRA